MARDLQRQRTRKALLQAASRLMAEGRAPSLDEVAEAAMVSRATAYRYFPGLDALLNEAALDFVAPSPGILLSEAAPSGLADRLAFVDAAFDSMIAAHEAPLRTMMINALQRSLRADGETPVRQNRRSVVIEAAIEGADEAIDPSAADRLAKAMALVVGTESMLVFRDVLRLDPEEARAVRRWAIDALVAAARG